MKEIQPINVGKANYERQTLTNFSQITDHNALNTSLITLCSRILKEVFFSFSCVVITDRILERMIALQVHHSVGLDTQKSGFGCPKSVWEMNLAGFSTIYNEIPAIIATKVKCFSSWEMISSSFYQHLNFENSCLS